VTDRPLRMAVLGLGRWGRTWVPVLRRTPGVVVAATAGGRRDGLDLPGVPHHDRAAGALAAADVDAVLVTLPVAAHLDAVRDAVDRGLHVLVEKPAVGTSAELEALRTVAERARRAGTVLMVVQNYRERPWARAARAAVADLGELASVAVTVARTELLDGGRDALAHPLLDDLAIHHLDLLRHLTGREADVLTAVAHRPSWSAYTGSPDVTALLELDGGVPVTYTGTWAARGRETPYDGDWAFRGERGCVEVRDLVVTRDGVPVPLRAGTAEGSPDDAPDADLGGVLHTFLRAVRGRGPVPTDVDDHACSLGLTLSLRDVAVRP
jgi:predicted dehydrogenase